MKLSDYNIPNLHEVLKRAQKDSDPASAIYFGEHPSKPEFAVIIVKGEAPVKMVAAELERLKLLTPGKPIEDGMPLRGTEFPPTA